MVQLIIDTVIICVSCLGTVYPAALCGYPLGEFCRKKVVTSPGFEPGTGSGIKPPALPLSYEVKPYTVWGGGGKIFSRN